eukprot:scaffold3014_cov116-Cylindrotheca_fusiformis.AAC.5
MAGQEEVVRYELSLSAYFKRLFHVSSTYATVEIVDGPNLGETECIPNSTNPDWCRSFYLSTLENVSLKISVWDFQNGSSPWRIGTVTLKATAIFDKKGPMQARIGPKKSSLCVMAGEESGALALHLRGLDMRNREPGPFGLGRSDPFFELARKSSREDDHHHHWNVIYRSEKMTNILNPMWLPTQIGVQELCFGDLTWPLKIVVYDYNKYGKHAFMGEYVTSVQEMQEHLSIRGNADREQALPMIRLVEDVAHVTGYICVLKASIGPFDKDKVPRQKKAAPAPKKWSWGLIVAIIFIAVGLPAIFSTTLPHSTITIPSATTQETTDSEFYQEYLDDFTMALSGASPRVGYFASLHVLNPRARALKWIMSDEQNAAFNITTTDPAILFQRYAMAALYYATNRDSSWTRESNFLSTRSVCDWNGDYGDSVYCSPSQQVVHISLIEKGLTGSLPAELGLLFNLNGLWLPSNDITGPIPRQLGLLRNLRGLYLCKSPGLSAFLSSSYIHTTSNLLTQIPNAVLLLAKNGLTGLIPSELSSLTSLNYLHLEENPLLHGNLDKLCQNVNRASFYGAADCLTENQYNVILFFNLPGTTSSHRSSYIGPCHPDSPRQHQQGLVHFGIGPPSSQSTCCCHSSRDIVGSSIDSVWWESFHSTR